MHPAYALAAAAAFLAAAPGAGAAELPHLEGRWINQTILATAKRTRSVRAAVRQFPLITEIAFHGGARARFGNEVESWDSDFQVAANGDVRFPRLAGAGVDALLRAAPAGRSFTLVVPRHGTRYVFVRQRVPLEAAFRTALNGALIAGSYHDLALGPPHYTNEVHFASDGMVFGLRRFDRYELCIAGDCAAMSREDMMELAGAEGAENFLFRFNGPTLILHRAVNTTGRDDKPEYVAGEAFLHLTRAGAPGPRVKGRLGRQSPTP